MVPHSIRSRFLEVRLALSLLTLMTLAGPLSAGAQAVLAPNVASGNVNVGSSANATMTFTFTTAETVSSIVVVTQGTAGLDFQREVASPGSCTATSYALNATCTVNITFKPLAPGIRTGAVRLLNSSGTLVGLGHIGGVGVGPLVTTTPAVQVFDSSGGAGEIFESFIDAAGNVFVADYGQEQVGEYPAGSNTMVQVALDPTSYPQSVVVDGAGNIFYAENAGTGVYKIDALTHAISTVVSGLSGTGNLAIDSADNIYYVTGYKTIQKYSAAGVVSTAYTATDNLEAIAVDTAGNLYSMDMSNGNVLKVTGGTASTLYAGYFPSQVYSIKVDPAGNVYLAPTGTTGKISRISPTGALSTYATGFTYSFGLGLAPNGDLYVGDETNFWRVNRSTFPTAVVSGTTAVHVKSATTTNYVENSGNANLTFSSIVADTNSAVDSTVSTPCSTSTPVAAPGSCNVGVQLDPANTNTDYLTGIVTATNNSYSSPALLEIAGYVGGGAHELAVNTAPATGVLAGGNAGTVKIQIEDEAATFSPNQTNAVTLVITGPSSYSQTYGPTNAVAGIATFNLAGAALTAVGTYTYTASATGLTGTSTTATIVPAAANHFTVVPNQSNTYAGTPDILTVTAYDQYNNLATTYTGTVKLTSTDATATLPANFTTTSGVATTSITFNAVSVSGFTATATDTITSATTGTSALITVAVLPTYIVTVANDPGSGTASNCSNQSLSGATLDANCSLRDALAAVDAFGVTGATAAQPIIRISPTLYGSTVTVTSQLSISHNISLQGPGPDATFTVAGKASTISLRQTGTGTATTISGLTFSAGHPAFYTTGAGNVVNLSNDIFDSNSTTNGGAITATSGSLNITLCSFTRNTAVDGGALYASGETTTIANTSFGGTFNSINYGNTATGFGGAVYFSSSNFNITNSGFLNNSATITTGTTEGGALFASNTSTYTGLITNSTFSANTSGGSISYGGALYLSGTSAPYKLTGVTIAGNKSTSASGTTHSAGGLYSGSTTSLYNTTITANSASSFGGVDRALGTVNAYNSVISGNLATTADKDEAGVSVQTPGSYVDTITTITCTTNCTPMLSQLANNGGPTVGTGIYATTLQTMLPLPGSPLLRAGNNTATYTNTAGTDARGYPRALGGYVDTGATEAAYTASFVQQPTNTATSTNVTPSPSVQLYESATPVVLNLLSTSTGLASGTGATLTITGSPTALVTTPATATTDTTTGIATFPGISIATAQTSETLIASVQTGSTYFTETSTPFNVTGLIDFGTAPPATITTGGNAGAITVQELNSNGTVYTSGNDNITLTVLASGYTTAHYTQLVVNGIATFNLSADALTPAGTYTYSAAASSYTAQTAIATETVAAASAELTALAVTGLPSTVDIGSTHTITVTAQSSGATMTSYLGTVTLSSSDPAVVIVPSTYTFQATDAGVHTFSVTLNTLGTQSITASAAGAGGPIAGSQTGIFVSNSIWLVNANGTLTKLDGSGSLVTSGVGQTTQNASFGSVAFDHSGDLWSVNSSINQVTFATKAGSSPTVFGGGGLNAPVSVMVDGNGYIWIANSGTNTISAFNNSGTAQSGTAGYGSSAIGAAPSALAIDGTGGVWVTSKTGNTVTHILGAAAPVVTPTSSAVANGTIGATP